MAVTPERRVQFRDRQESNCRLAFRVWLYAVLVAALAQERQAENFLIELPHAWQVANAEHDLGNSRDCSA